MKNKQTKSRITLTVAIVFCIVAALLIYYFFVLQPGQKDDHTTTSDSSSQTSDTDDADSASDESKQDDTTNSAKNTADDDESSGSTNSDSKLSITAAFINGSTFDIRTNISKVTDAGTCSLSMKRDGGGSYSDQAGVQALPSSSTCKGFDVPMSALSSGTWSITVIYENGSVSSTATKEVVINA